MKKGKNSFDTIVLGPPPEKAARGGKIVSARSDLVGRFFHAARNTVRGLLTLPRQATLSILGSTTLLASIAGLQAQAEPVMHTLAATVPVPQRPTVCDASGNFQRSALFTDTARRINLTGETGVWVATLNGTDDNCREFSIYYQDAWRDMMTRHRAQAADTVQGADYRIFLNDVREYLMQQHGRIDMNDPGFRTLAVNAVNRYVDDNFTYVRDPVAWGQEDYFATPGEMLSAAGRPHRRFVGDRDDSAAMKMHLLLDLGLDPRLMYAVFVGNRTDQGAQRTVNHMVLIVAAPGGGYLTLDNSAPGNARSLEYTDYESYLAIPADGRGAYFFPQAMQRSNTVHLASSIRPTQELPSPRTPTDTQGVISVATRIGGANGFWPM